MIDILKYEALVSKINESKGWSELPATEILPGVWLGTVWNADELFDSNPHDIAGVITIAPNLSYAWQGRDARLRRAPGIDYSEVSFPDRGPVVEEDFWKQVNKGKEFMDAKVPFLTHCTLGSNRSPSILASILQHAGIMAFDDAVELMSNLRLVVRPAPEMTAICKGYLATKKVA